MWKPLDWFDRAMQHIVFDEAMQAIKLFQLRTVQIIQETYIGVGSPHEWGVVVLGGIPT